MLPASIPKAALRSRINMASTIMSGLLFGVIPVVGYNLYMLIWVYKISGKKPPKVYEVAFNILYVLSILEGALFIFLVLRNK